MNLTTAQLKTIMPRAPEVWLAALADGFRQRAAMFDDANEVASVIAQVAHESSEFTRLEENLNYSAVRLAQVWPRFAANPGEKDLSLRIPNDLAYQNQHNPEKLANYIYADANRPATARLGNKRPGDGWRYHGRGPIQCTGFDVYGQCGAYLGIDLVNHPEKLLEPETGIGSVFWFWESRKLFLLDDDTAVRAETRVVNGGETGLADRQTYFNNAIKVLT